MRSQLSRAYSELFANRRDAFAGCQNNATQRRTRWAKLQSCPTFQSRPIFGQSLGSTSTTMLNAQNTPGYFEKALRMLVDLMRSRRARSKLPPQAKIIDAFNFLFRSRFEVPRRFLRNEIYLATEAFKYLQEQRQANIKG